MYVYIYTGFDDRDAEVTRHLADLSACFVELQTCRGLHHFMEVPIHAYMHTYIHIRGLLRMEEFLSPVRVGVGVGVGGRGRWRGRVRVGVGVGLGVH